MEGKKKIKCVVCEYREVMCCVMNAESVRKRSYYQKVAQLKREKMLHTTWREKLVGRKLCSLECYWEGKNIRKETRILSTDIIKDLRQKIQVTNIEIEECKERLKYALISHINELGHDDVKKKIFELQHAQFVLAQRKRRLKEAQCKQKEK